LDHVAGTSFFVPSNLVISDQVQPHSGGSTLLWQRLFWFFGHPEVYVAIVPGMGIISHVLITSMRKPLLSHRVVVYSMGALAVLSYMVYGHHMFVSGMNPFSSLMFSFPTLVITIPSTIIVLIWIGSLYGSKLRINSASLFALGFISMFISGGVSGFFLAQPSVDILQPLIPVHKFITIAALVTGAAQLVFIYNLIHSRVRGEMAPLNPWQATSLEWSTPSSPPPFDNFGGRHPVVYHDPYQYGIEG